MKKIMIYAGGKAKGTPYDDAVKTYIKRIHMWSVQVVDVPDAKWDHLTRSPSEWWVGLCEKGTQWTSTQFHHQMDTWMIQSKKVCFFIGPANGLSASMISKCHVVMSLSLMTWPHLMARSMLVEQIYRAQQIKNGHPYGSI